MHVKRRLRYTVSCTVYRVCVIHCKQASPDLAYSIGAFGHALAALTCMLSESQPIDPTYPVGSLRHVPAGDSEPRQPTALRRGTAAAPPGAHDEDAR